MDRIQKILSLQPMDYRELFVKFEREAKGSTFVNVLLDGRHLAWFTSEAITQEEFNKDCRAFIESDRYKKAMAEVRGGVTV